MHLRLVTQVILSALISEHFPLTSWFTATDRLLLGTCDPYFTNNEIVVLKMSEIFHHYLFGFLNYLPSESAFNLPPLLKGQYVISYIHCMVFLWKMGNAQIFYL